MGKIMRFVKATKDDLSRLSEFYKYVIDNTEDMSVYCRWIYGLHPSDDMILEYIEQGCMYYAVEDDGLKIIAAFAVTFNKGEDYHAIKWNIEASDDEVAVIHILCTNPDLQGHGYAKSVVEDIINMARLKNLKAVRHDALDTNIPAHKLYESMGFDKRGVQNWYACNLGWADFWLYEYVI